VILLDHVQPWGLGVTRCDRDRILLRLAHWMTDVPFA